MAVPPLNNTAAAASDSATPAFLVGWNGTNWQPVLVDSSGRLITGGTGPGVSEQVVGNVAHDAVDSGNPVKVGGKASSTAPSVVASGDRVDAWFAVNGAAVISGVGTATDVVTGAAAVAIPSSNAFAVLAAGQHGWDGAAYPRLRAANVFKPQDALSVASEATWWTPASGKKVRLMGGVFTGSVVGNYVIRDNTAGTTIAVIPVGVAGAAVTFTLGNGILSAAANNVLTVDGPPASTASGILFGTEE